MNSIFNNILVITLSAMDFWVVKNLSGRYLVNLRWWNKFDKDGNSIYYFETAQTPIEVNLVDKSFFWTSIIAGVLVWGFFLFINIISFNFIKAFICSISFIFCMTNLMGYYQCSSGIFLI